MITHLRANLSRKLKTVLLMVLLVMGGCDAPMPELDLSPTINELFTAIQQDDLDKAMEIYPNEFFKAYPREYWRSRLQKFSDYMGTMESFRIRNRQADTRFSGKFFIYRLETVHMGQGKKDKKKARHIVTFVLPVDGGPVRLVGHKISAKGFSTN